MQHCNKYHHNQNLPVFDTAGPCPACLRESDVSDDHAMCCGAGGERISRHNNLRDAVYETPVAAGLGPVKEGRFLLPGTDRRPADILVPNWVVGKDAAMDVTIVTPLQAVTMPAAAQTAGHALNHAYDRKVNERSCVGDRALPSCPWWQRPLVAGMRVQSERSRSLALPSRGTLGRRKGRPSPTCGAGWASYSSGAMLLNGKSCGKSSGESSGESSGKSAKTKKVGQTNFVF